MRTSTRSGTRAALAGPACVVAAVFTLVVGVASAIAAPVPGSDSFYSYQGSAPLGSVSSGTVLKSRTVQFHFAGIATPVPVVQLLYRTTTALGAPSVTVASVIQPFVHPPRPRLVSYQSAYDSLSANCQPSTTIAGGFGLDPLGSVFTAESASITGLLMAGYTVVTSDFEGERPDFAVGPQYGRGTLDGIRAALSSPTVGLPADVKVALMGYSGGGIATEWASELAPSYAPDINGRLVGAAMGGLPVNLFDNLNYANGSPLWSTVVPMAVVGIARAYHIDLRPYLNDYGERVAANLQHACPDQAAFGGGLLSQWQQMTKPQYARPESIPVLVRTVNKLIMSTGGTPAVPLYIAQGGTGELELTPTRPDLGPGDGIMLAADTSGLAQEYCHRGVPVQYEQYPLSHSMTADIWGVRTLGWLADRFNGLPAPQNCSTLPPGRLPRPLPEP